ncbi:MAG: DUF6320 domain-containing protein [Christensenella sp.]
MGKCEYCNVSVEEREVCPLCGRQVGADKAAAPRPYPRCDTKIEKASGAATICKAAAISVCIIAVCALINLLTYSVGGNYWFVDVAVIFIYFWVLILNTIRAKIAGSLKLMVQALVMGSLLCVFDGNANGGMWSVNFAIPIMCMAFVSLIMYIVVTKKLSWNEYIGYMIVVLLCGQGAVTGAILGIVRFGWLSIAAAGYAALTFLMMLIFANGRYKSTRVKRIRF